MNESDKHWLYRTTSRRKLWITGIAILIVTVISELFIKPHSHFAITGFFAFHAGFGFITCVAMVLFAKLLGFLVKRRDDYYDS